MSVKNSPDPSLTRISGLVLDETKNTLTMETDKRTIKVAKRHTTFQATLPTGEIVEVNGDQLRHRPEDRIKRGITKW